MKIILEPDITVKTPGGPIEVFLCHQKQIDSRTLKALVALVKCTVVSMGDTVV